MRSSSPPTTASCRTLSCAPLMIDYIGPSLDTTISAISNALHLFATHPEQWQLLKDDPALIPNAVNEIVRYESPLRAFSRKARHDTDIAGVRCRPAHAYWSSTRPPTATNTNGTAPDTFDIRRDATRQLGFGYGAHACAGQGLARLETQAMLRALVERVDRYRTDRHRRRGRSTTSSADTSGYR